MKWLQPFAGLSNRFSAASLNKKRTQEQAASSSVGEGTDTADLVAPASESDEEFNSRPKRRSVDVQRWSMDLHPRSSMDRRTSLDKWHEARRIRNSLEGEGTITTDRLTVCKAGTTTIVNRTYITIKHLGSGTFGRVMLCFNVYDQRLYAIKVCRKSQFLHSLHSGRQGHGARLRRNMSNSTSAPAAWVLAPPGTAPGAAAAAAAAAAVAAGMGGGGHGCHTMPGPGLQQQQVCGLSGNGVYHSSLPPVPSSCAAPHPVTTNITAFSGSAAAGLQPPPQPPPPCTFSRQATVGSTGLGSSSSVDGRPSPQPCLPQQSGGGAGLVQQQQQQLAPSLEMFGVRPLPTQRRFSYQGTPGHAPGWWAEGGGGTNGGGGGGAVSAGGGGVVGGGVSCPGGSAVAAPTDSCGSGAAGGYSSVFAEALTRFQTEELVKEIAILKKLSHPNIVNLVEVIDDPSTDSLLMVMEYVEGGTLERRHLGRNRWETVPEQEVWANVREVLQGLDYLHFNKVVHGDLKPSNLLRDSNSGKVKIADFGSSIMAGGDKVFSMRNSPGFSTPAFRSPESLTSGYQPSFEMDMWALGVCIYMWVYGHLPFTGAAPFVVYERIRSQEVVLPDQQEVSPELQDFLARLLDKDVLQRLDVGAALSHPWVNLGGTAPLASQRDAQFAASVGLGNAAALGRAAGGGPRGPLGQSLLGGSGGGCGGGGVMLRQEDLVSAIRPLEGGVGHLMDVVFTEETYSDGQTIIAQGELADSIHLIAAGQVELVAEGPASLPPAPLLSGLAPDMGDPQDNEMFDATVPELGSSPSGLTSALLSEDVLNGVGGSPTRGRGVPSARSSSESCSGRVIAVKGSGDSLGLPNSLQAALATSSSGSSGGGVAPAPQGEVRWQVCARARGAVTVFRVRCADLGALVAAHPEMEGAVRQMLVQQETDMMVAEAMRQLRLYNGGGGAGGPHPVPAGL